jgi:hypothetical protein
MPRVRHALSSSLHMAFITLQTEYQFGMLSRAAERAYSRITTGARWSALESQVIENLSWIIAATY